MSDTAIQNPINSAEKLHLERMEHGDMDSNRNENRHDVIREWEYYSPGASLPRDDLEALYGLSGIESDSADNGGSNTAGSNTAIFRYDPRTKKFRAINNKVGVISLPSGAVLEILPKIGERNEDARRLLHEMVTIFWRAKKVISKETEVSTQLLHTPIVELLITLFLQQCSHVLRGRLARKYHDYEEAEYFVRGSIDFGKQSLQALAVPIHLKYQKFETNRPENRLLKSALLKSLQLSRNLNSASNYQRAQRFLAYFEDIPRSTHIAADMQAWERGRSLVHYHGAKALTELLLKDRLPSPVHDAAQKNAFSLLFSMDELFEFFIAQHLRDVGVHVDEQVKLGPFMEKCGRDGADGTGRKPFFQLGPDFRIHLAAHGKEHAKKYIADAKWKRLNPNADYYGLAREDMYQLFAYLHYNKPASDGMLFYPQTKAFMEKQEFVYSATGGGQLSAIPFDCLNPKTSAQKIKAELERP